MFFRPNPRRTLVAALLCLCSHLCLAQQLALSFDDGFNPEAQPGARQWNAQLLATLEARGIQAALFPSLVRLGNGAGLELLGAWAQAGHMIGNHTASHRSLAAPEVSLDGFIADVETADDALRGLSTFVPMLRFPYLKEGDTLAKRDGMRAWMKRRGYRPAPVSIDASDWYYNRIYAGHLAAGETGKAGQVKQRYIDHLLDRAAYYDGLARRALGRSPAHVMLLHTNQLNADALGEVIDALNAKGWRVIPARSAFADSLYDSPPDTLPAGESVIWAQARAAGIPGLRYPAEDAVYEAPRLREAGLIP